MDCNPDEADHIRRGDRKLKGGVALAEGAALLRFPWRRGRSIAQRVVGGESPTAMTYNGEGVRKFCAEQHGARFRNNMDGDQRRIE